MEPVLSSIQVHAKIGFSQGSHIDQNWTAPVPSLLSSTETADNSVLSDCTSLRSIQGAHHLDFCIGGAVLVIGTPLEYVQGSRCDLVCSSGACDVSCSKK